MDDTLRMVEWYIAGIFALGCAAFLFRTGLWYRRFRWLLDRRAAARARRDSLLTAAKKNMAQELVQKAAAMSRDANKVEFMAARIYRRDATIYFLSSTVNHLVGCWLSENFEPMPLLIPRGRKHMQEFPSGKPEAQAYYDFVVEYFDTIEAALRSGGLWVEY